MNTQQRRPFFQAVKSRVHLLSSVDRPGSRPRGLAVILSAVLLCSCSTLTPDRIAVLAALAGNAAQIGVEEWLRQHPTHRASFEAVARAIAAFLAAQPTPPEGMTADEFRESKAVELLSSMPTRTLASKEGGVYLTGTPGTSQPQRGELVIYDEKLKKASVIEGAAVEPVLRGVRDGMRRALAVRPPMPTPARFTYRGWTNDPAFAVVTPPPISTTGVEALRASPVGKSPMPLIAATGSSPVLGAGAATTPSSAEPLKVTAPPQSIPPGKYAPRGRAVYAVERKHGTNWSVVQSFTNQVGEWRVRRLR